MATIEDVYDFLKNESPTYFLATADGSQPRVRPFGTVDLFEGHLYIQTGKSKDVYKQILANPKVELCAWKGPKWLRVSGELVPDDRVAAKRHMLDAYPSLRDMYDENDENTIVLYFKDACATFSTFGPEPNEVARF
ncbi:MULTISPECIES: pyridoxamine 5'-phosphate oxidase family protein [Atopobiaceae]|uniref:Uncharacterized protein, pyridoxamine 5'-phosphate oxidase (PNPOx-like) family n=1 Tax=Parafannyhessea umbonata TaxID=604330 RepID=A0A1H6I897_9ACTN|nr:MULTISPECIES: pyridoxamine 5'-phosphate oxidase family protein [Atopobiaceae]SEH42551.1 Uncharacterized protein, pyridoxamine 5'-phosphate oxidase (PNPOx-like) family [Parafannyhessea umbonata]SJZ56685.1 Uncharacterized protein, pyridoxamine 5'-phosphate oxidase (PNPOx-like) family [Olsenella sp. KH1P3]